MPDLRAPFSPVFDFVATRRIDTTEGPRDCPAGYYIVKDSRGGIYPVHPEEFENGYQLAGDEPGATVVPLRRPS